MTDYLEELLAEEEQENEQDLQWTKAVRVGLASVRKIPEVDGGEETEVRQNREAIRNSRPHTGPDIILEMERLSRAVVRAHTREQGQTGERQGGTAVSAMQYIPGAGAAVRTGAAAVDYVGLVDAAFERDARRYDGPLGLL
ncbi:MAG: hypothetical protein J6A62_05190 [Oscillospiraceae bacterium]|nr:hypothetical protein [Oscillospiraceae bacterium]